MEEKSMRQLQRMRTQLALYRAQQTSVKALVDDLEFLLSHMDDAPQSWRNEMLAKLGVLEDTYAVALDKGEKSFCAADLERMAIAIDRIGALVESRFHETREE